MKRALAVVMLVALPLAAAAEKWWDAYKRGVTAVNSKNYRAAAEALSKSIAEMPNEGLGVRARNEIITYVPHFWLGIAKFNLGDVEGALREWKISEEQGAISKTEYYSNMKDWVARAHAEQRRNAQNAASGAKKAADAAISRALAMQVDALSAGGDRSDSYRAAQRKLQDAMGTFGKAGTDVNAYAAAEQTAAQAITLFNAAAEEGKKLKAQRAAAPKPKPQVPLQQAPAQMPVNVVPAPQPAPVKVEPPVKSEPAPVPVPVESEAEVAAKLAVQEFRRDAAEARLPLFVRASDRLRVQLERAKNDADFARVAREAGDRRNELAERLAELNAPKPARVVVTETPLVPPPLSDLDPGTELRYAYRAFAAGDLAESEDLLTKLLGVRKTAEAYLLRGCTRYTKAMLSRTPDALLAAAAEDFKAALAQNRALRLDSRAFSPKVIAFFEQVRNGR